QVAAAIVVKQGNLWWRVGARARAEGQSRNRFAARLHVRAALLLGGIVIDLQLAEIEPPAAAAVHGQKAVTIVIVVILLRGAGRMRHSPNRVVGIVKILRAEPIPAWHCPLVQVAGAVVREGGQIARAIPERRYRLYVGSNTITVLVRNILPVGQSQRATHR